MITKVVQTIQVANVWWEILAICLSLPLKTTQVANYVLKLKVFLYKLKGQLY